MKPDFLTCTILDDITEVINSAPEVDNAAVAVWVEAATIVLAHAASDIYKFRELHGGNKEESVANKEESGGSMRPLIKSLDQTAKILALALERKFGHTVFQPRDNAERLAFLLQAAGIGGDERDVNAQALHAVALKTVRKMRPGLRGPAAIDGAIAIAGELASGTVEVEL